MNAEVREPGRPLCSLLEGCSEGVWFQALEPLQLPWEAGSQDPGGLGEGHPRTSHSSLPGSLHPARLFTSPWNYGRSQLLNLLNTCCCFCRRGLIAILSRGTAVGI